MRHNGWIWRNEQGRTNHAGARRAEKYEIVYLNQSTTRYASSSHAAEGHRGTSRGDRMNLHEILDQARARIAVTSEELTEAKRRRRCVAEALETEFGGRVFFNGSLEHGDANDPLTDFDIGVVVPNGDGVYGPGAKSATDLKERVRIALRDALGEEYPNLRIEVDGRKRSVLVRFSSPISDRADDFTGDVIVAIDHAQAGLHIPRYDGWDRSHPEKHTELILAANTATSNTTAHANRLLKFWSCRHDNPLCSWHIKVLSRAAITNRMSLADALETFFDYAHSSLLKGDTPDPACVGPDIAPRVNRTHACARLHDALENVRAAKEQEAAGKPLHAQAKLANVLPGIVDRPSDQDLADEDRNHELARLRAAGNLVGVGVGANAAIANTRGWSHD